MGFSIGSSLTHSLGSIAGGAIGGIFGGPAGAAVGSQIGGMIGPSQERMDRRNYNYQYNKSLKAWNLQNEYNSPLQQMQRLKEAGLNPMLVYGSGNVTGNSSSSIDLPTLGQSDVMANANHFTNTMGEMASNSFRQNMQEQRIAAQQGLANNELDLQYKQLQLELLQKKLDNFDALYLNNNKDLQRLVLNERLASLIEDNNTLFSKGSIKDPRKWEISIKRLAKALSGWYNRPSDVKPSADLSSLIFE